MSTIGTLICGSSSRGSAGDDGRQQQERRQRRIDEGAGQQP
jgi:hypothetical protein